MGKLLKSICLMVLGNSQLLIQGIMSSATFTFVNKCDQTVWPGISSNAGIARLESTGFALKKGEAKVLTAPSPWGGKVWGRTHCSKDSDGKFTCGTGDCGSGKLECAGSGASPPATLAEFTVAGDGGMDFFHISLVGGYNLPMMVTPSGGSGHNCASIRCTLDLNNRCPSALKVMNYDGEVVACKSACVAFGQQEDCCRGAYGSRETCKPSYYSQVFKALCPRALSYAYDDQTTTFTCTGADYEITFCPPSSTSNKSNEEQPMPATPQFNTGLVYEDNDAAGNSKAIPRSTYIHVTVVGTSVVVLSFVAYFGVRRIVIELS